MAEEFLTESPTETKPSATLPPREPVRVIVVGSRQSITTVVHWLVRIGFTQMAEWSSFQPTPTGQWMRVMTKWVQRK